MNALELPLPEPVIRLGSFLIIFGILAVFELTSPRLERPEMIAALKSRRWFTNVSVLVLSSISLRIIFPVAAVGTALWAETQGWGLLNQLAVPGWLAGIVAIIVLDFAVWLEHVLSHKLPWLWRIHRMHHSDTGFDVTTALRFHPLEIVLSMFWKAAIVISLGAPAWSVLVFEVVLNGTAMFNHSNVSIPQWADRLLRKFIVTPDMHRVHHSSTPMETDSNYGFNLSIWDRWFSTYTAQPAAGHDGMEIGLKAYRGKAPSGLWWILKLPFAKR
ncbi:sterol desaturase family protein [Devosia algicola]|uniref:Sterol desaturase family protein n=1 Tax=Devosia algicola TaxID=3026418 RepID=A0ABY7YPN7_9HYPH|nr:sterol desaturase family protein [Devosia algicola]WDR02850.1 sterol desaturase family protein [Devosia algicola]